MESIARQGNALSEFLMVLYRRKHFILIIILALSAFVHLWNAAAFPDFFYDEGVYMRRAMHIQAGLGLQERYFYDHPYFGPIFLAGFLSAVGYPASLHPTGDAQSIASLYLVPRLLMGILAVSDTFLVFKISERYYGRGSATASSLLFAVMPITWFTRRILLDSILLPFLLLSVLLAIYSKNSKRKSLLIILSGVCMGVAIFTKESMLVMIPLIVFILYQNGDVRRTWLWLVSAVPIPLIWPALSIRMGEFNLWLGDIAYQAGRSNGGLPALLGGFLIYDPILFIVGLVGIAFMAARKDLFPLFWAVPFFALFSAVNFVQYFYWIPIIPIFCIAGGWVIMAIKKKIGSASLSHVMLASIAILGLGFSVLLVTTNVSAQADSMAFVASYLANDRNATLISSPSYSWIFHYVFHDSNVFADYRDLLFCPVITKDIVLVADPHFHAHMGDGKPLSMVYGNTTTVRNFTSGIFGYGTSAYPYTNLRETFEGSVIDVRTAHKAIDTGVVDQAGSRNVCADYFG